ncbi:DoxX family protein [Adhaeribacter terreus]|uniref:DoxX family protein n=1 Tax=Adhaeribacter terreus TaxID=529703 RepID=A0ABW0EFH5_9BACT
MKVLKITYWATTAVFSLMMAFSAFAYVTQPEMKQGFAHLGFPDYFRVELAVAKLLGAVILLAPVATRFKEWAYAGFGIVVISAFIAHTAAGDPLSARIGPLVALALLLTSYFTYHKKQQPAGMLN